MAKPTHLIKPRQFWRWVDARLPDQCWPWLGRIDRHGYGEHVQRINKRRYWWRAHRVAYELLIGPIPEGLVIDHLCRNRACCNPGHLEPVTAGENIRRSPIVGRGKASAQRSKTHCIHGHEFTPENTYWRQGKWRCCKACADRRRAKHRGQE